MKQHILALSIGSSLLLPLLALTATMVTAAAGSRLALGCGLVILVVGLPIMLGVEGWCLFALVDDEGGSP